MTGLSHISLSQKGQNINLSEDKLILKDNLYQAGIKCDAINFQSNGADIIAIKQNIIWKIECKGFSNSAESTNRNNFDRALSSTVTYFDNNTTQLGISLPIYYKKDVYKRISKALRQAINLSIFYYDPNYNEIEHIAPCDDLHDPSDDWRLTIPF